LEVIKNAGKFHCWYIQRQTLKIEETVTGY